MDFAIIIHHKTKGIIDGDFAKLLKGNQQLYNLNHGSRVYFTEISWL